VVTAGDNLWRIAERHLAAVTGRPVEAMPLVEVHAYWLRVIEANHTGLRSGDPNLIYPGETLTLPPETVE
jgi:nucleoid-associated protein YgaU